MKRLLIPAALMAAALAVAGYFQADEGAGPSTANAGGAAGKVLFRDAGGNPVGTAKLTDEDGTVLVRVNLHDIPAGFHGFHVHSTGVCVAPFTSAGGHYNPGGQSHPNHAADMPLLYANTDGTGEARFKTDRYGVADLFDADGSALIIHAGADNYANIPTARYDPDPDATTLATGDAGARFACGVIDGD